MNFLIQNYSNHHSYRIDSEGYGVAGKFETERELIHSNFNDCFDQGNTDEYGYYCIDNLQPDLFSSGEQVTQAYSDECLPDRPGDPE